MAAVFSNDIACLFAVLQSKQRSLEKDFSLRLGPGPFPDGLADEGWAFWPNISGKLKVGRNTLNAVIVHIRFNRGISFRGCSGTGSPIQDESGKNTLCDVH